MKLGFLLFDYFPFGGLQRDCLKTAKLCAARGHEVILFTRTWQGERPAGIHIELFGRHGWSNLWRNRVWLKQLQATLPSLGMDGVIGFNKLPGLDVYYGSDPCYAARIRRLKPAWYRWLPRYRHFAALEKLVFTQGQRTEILVLTDHEIPSYQEFYGTERHRFHVLPPGITRRDFSPQQKQATHARLRQEHGWAVDERILLLVGSGFRVKGLDRAIRSLAALDAAVRASTRLVVIGQNRPGEFALLARQLGVHEQVHFLGGRHDVFDWLLAADLLIHPARSEAAGMILLEALTAGLPVMATDVCGYARHIERAEAGRVLPSPFSQAQCDTTAGDMLISPHRERWSRNGLAYAAHEDLYSCHARAVELIENIVGQKKHPVQLQTPGGAGFATDRLKIKKRKRHHYELNTPGQDVASMRDLTVTRTAANQCAMKYAFALIALCAASLLSAADAPATFPVSEFTFKRPANWEWVETTSQMRKAQLKVNGADKKNFAEVVFFHFGPSNGGGVKANVDRWYSQFQEPREKIGAKSEEATIGKHKVTFVRAEGTFLSGMPGGERTPQPGYALRGAIIEAAEGDVFVKMTGPAALVKSAEGDFRKLIESALK